MTILQYSTLYMLHIWESNEITDGDIRKLFYWLFSLWEDHTKLGMEYGHAGGIY